MIEVKRVSKYFQSPDYPILRDINLTVQSGEFVSLIGKSGSGKTTLLYAISSLDRPNQGTVQINGQDIYALKESEIHQFRNQKMGFVFQFHDLLPELTAFENIIMPLRKAKLHQQNKDYAEYLLERFDVIEQRNQFPDQMSGGQQQRIAIARAIVAQPDYLFADEPTGHLDSQNAQEVMDIFVELNTKQSMTIVFVTHDIDFSNVANRKLHLIDGRIVD